jgi:hypothetical protein
MAAHAVPRHQAIGADRDVGLDLHGEIGVDDAEIGGGERASAPRADRQRQVADRAVGEQRRHQRVGLDGLGIGDRQLPREEGVGGAFREPARMPAGGMRPGQQLGAVAGAVAVRVVARAVRRGGRLRIQAEGDLPGVGQGVPVAVGALRHGRARATGQEQDREQR